MISPTSFFADYGCHVRISGETRILQKLGHQITIATYHNGKNVDGIDIRRTLPIPWRRTMKSAPAATSLSLTLLLGLKTLELLARGHYDIIHAHLHKGALIAHVVGKLFGLPVVFDFQGSLTEEMIDHHSSMRESLFYKPLRRLESWINRTSSVIFTSSSPCRTLYCWSNLRVTRPRCACCPIVSTPMSFALPRIWMRTAQLELRRRLNIPDGHKVIVYLGLLTEYQGIGLLLQAHQRILSVYPNVYLLLMGFPGVQHYRDQRKILGN